MRYSSMLIPTSKQPPKDAVLKSHKFLMQAGYIHQSGSGMYSLLPLGKIVLERIIHIIRKHMNRAGAQEVLLSFVTPSNLWEASGRYDKYGQELLRFTDRKDASYVLGPTHEESMTQLVQTYVQSYKSLPINLYQIHLKFRDEMRPRFGLLRTREFFMKDAYSFHSTQQDLEREFHNMFHTYNEIFTELGLDFRAVEADSGAIGGSGSKEFMVLADAGEDTLITCEACSYAANIEAATRAKRIPIASAPKARFARFPTPNVKTIDDVCALFHIHPFYALKAVVKKFIYIHTANNEQERATRTKHEEFVVFFLRGDDMLEERKAHNALCAMGYDVLEILEAEAEELVHLGLISGSIGAVGIKAVLGDRPIIFDEDLRDASDMICGGNEVDTHVVGVDFSTFAHMVYAPLAFVKEGDICARCGGKLTQKRGIEVGHIFMLNDTYSRALGATFLRQDSCLQPFLMGCYGIGVSRLLPAILEQKSDSKGCVWSKASAPFSVQIIIANIKEQAQQDYGLRLYHALQERGIASLCDERDIRFGAKMADFELVGAARYGIIIGKSVESCVFEWIKRDGLVREEIHATSINALCDVIEGRVHA